MEIEKFNIRVYGVLINDNQELLISDENYKGVAFTKLPGGGLCFGESLPEALIREFREECNLEIEVGKLLHVTDTFVPSAFDDSQVIGIYYQVINVDPFFKGFRDTNVESNSRQSFRWVALESFSVSDFYFEMDRQAWQRIKELNS